LVIALEVRLRFYGVFRTAARTNELVIQVAGNTPTVRSVLMQLVTQKEFQGLKQLLLENENADPRPNALIMISGREINTLSGLETTLTEKDELALLPVAHGG
jgi:molybdopterin converting factor small subunit